MGRQVPLLRALKLRTERPAPAREWLQLPLLQRWLAELLPPLMTGAPRLSPLFRAAVDAVRALLLLYEQLEPRLFAAPAATAPLRDAVSIVATQWFLSLWSGTLPLRLMPVTAPPAPPLAWSE